jgi:hypothetical protein
MIVFAFAAPEKGERARKRKGLVERGFGRVWVAFEAVFNSGVRFLCSLCLFVFSSPVSVPLSSSSGFEREEREREAVLVS